MEFINIKANYFEITNAKGSPQLRQMRSKVHIKSNFYSHVRSGIKTRFLQFKI